MDTNWIEYKCKSGETLFIYNKVTGEHKWPTDYSTEENCVMIGHPVIYKELCTTGTQTDDNGCNNGCTSMYINTGHVINNTEISPQQQPATLGDIHVDTESIVDNGLDDGGREERGMDIIDAMLKVLEETYEDNDSKATDNSVNNKDSDGNMENVLQEGDGNDTEHLVEFTSDNNNAATDNYVHDNGIKEKGLKWSPWKHKENVFKCSYCDKKFNHKYRLTRHVRTHTGEKPFDCSYCKKTFTQRSHLTRHLRKHTEKKPFECSYCQKTFTQRSSLTNHLRKHTEKKPIECSYCQKTFTVRSHLTVHLRTHTGEKPFECSYCQKTFTVRSHLTNHLRTHTGEKPFECSYCKKTFTRRSNLTDHLRTHTGEKPFECCYCKKKFSHRISLTRHLRFHTREKLMK